MPKGDASAPRIKWLVEPSFDDDGVQRTAGIDQFGREHGDPTPLMPPVGMNVNQGGDELHRTLRNLFIREREAFRAAIEAEQFESEEEANDFACEEDLFPPGNEPWMDVHDFPAEPPGDAANGPTLASGAVKGGSRAPEDAAPPVVSSQTVSSSSLPESTKTEKTEQKPISDGRPGDQPVAPSGRLGST